MIATLLPVADTEMSSTVVPHQEMSSEVTLPSQSQIKPEEKLKDIVVSEKIPSVKPLRKVSKGNAKYDDDDYLSYRRLKYRSFDNFNTF